MKKLFLIVLLMATLSLFADEILNEPFTSDLGVMSAVSVDGDQEWFWQSYDDGCATMNGYSGGAVANEDWLITPVLDFTNYSDVEMNFREAINYESGSVDDNEEIYISTDYSGSGDPNLANWTELTVTGRASGGSWSFVDVDPVDLSAYDEVSNVYIGFKYNSTDTDAATWEVGEVVITGNPLSVLPEPDNQPTNFTATAPSYNQIDLSWTDAIGTNLPTGYLIKANQSGLFSAPVDGVDPTVDPDLSDGSALVKVFHGSGATHTFTGLSEESTYYFKIWSYSNSDTNIDFLLTGPPTADATTGAIPPVPALMISEITDPGDVYQARYIELYNASGSTIDFSSETWHLTKQANGANYYGTDLTGTLEPDSIYIAAYNADDFQNAYGFAPDLEFGSYNGNGDDGYFLFYGGDETSGILVDAYGVQGVDGTGEPWEYTDSHAERNAGVPAPNPTWTAAEWTIASADVADCTPGQTNLGGTGNIAPSITDITIDPTTPEPTDDVNVSADITDIDGTITSATLYWSLDENNLSNSINMSATRAIYTSDSPIPAQTVGTIVYYQVEAIDDSSATTLSNIENYEVVTASEVTIYDIQYTTDPSGDSPYAGQIVSTFGTVTAVVPGDGYYLQNGAGSWKGIYIDDAANTPAQGYNVSVTGEVVEQYNLTIITNVTDYTGSPLGGSIPNPEIISTGSVAEEYEGILVKFENAVCTNENLGYGEWEIDDGSGATVVDDQMYVYTPDLGFSYNITGPLTYTFGAFKIEPRDAADVVVIGDTDPPTISNVLATDGNTIEVTFSENVEETSAENTANYTIVSRDVVVSSAVRSDTDSTFVTLTVTGMDEGNYTLAAVGVEDLFGNPSDDSFDFSYFEPLPEGALVINEIMYNSPGNDNEWIELYNNTDTAIDLSNFYVLDDDNGHGHLVIPSGHTIAAYDYFTIALQVLSPPLAFTPDFDGSSAASWSLGNGGDEVRIFDPNHNLADNVPYDDGGDWPSSPDGDGPTLELIDPAYDNSLPASWQASAVDGGTPGAQNAQDIEPPTIVSVDAEDATTVVVVFNEFLDETSAEDVTNYSILSRDVIVSAAVLDNVSQTEVTLTVSGMATGDYTLSAVGVEDLAGNPSDDSQNFSYYLGSVDIVINELHYNPSSIQGDDDYFEFLELYNNGSVMADISGYNFTEGIDFTFPAGSTIAAGEYAVVTIDTSNYSGNGYQVFEWISGGLSNGGELVELRDNSGNVIDQVDYDDGGDWPSSPDGDGPSLELIDPSYDNSLPASWQASIDIGGTPGAENLQDLTAPIITSATAENGTTVLVTFHEDVEEISAETVTNYFIVSRDVTIISAVRNETVNSEVTLTVTGMSSGSYTLLINGVEDLSGNITEDGEDFAYSAFIPNLVINEIHYNPSSEQGNDDNYEFLEIYNAETEAADISGFTFTEGFDFTFPAGSSIAAGEYIVVTIDTSSYSGNGYQVFQFTGALSNGGEDIELQDAAGTVIDYVDYDDGGDWPSSPDGDGPSLELIDPTYDNTLPTSWQASTDLGGTPGAENSSGPSVLDPPVITSISHDGTDVTIVWESVTNATSYKIYSDSDPEGSFSTLEAEVTTGTTWTGTASEDKKFYQVTAVN